MVCKLKSEDLNREHKTIIVGGSFDIAVEVAQVTGHRNLNILWPVYTQLFPHKLHNKFIKEKD
mgnify:CR=1 FL=1